jgi:sterol desaturase/sphingolipid hydroxylase (fatty acid hydroxylase superfamily)
MTSIAIWASWAFGGCVSAEFLGYMLHRLLHSGVVGFLSRSHMRHHMVHYGPLHKQRTRDYLDATTDRGSLGNIGLEWLGPAAVLIAALALALHELHVRELFALSYLAATLGWSFLMFSYLHDVLHVDGVWLENSRWLKKWFVKARRRHDIHHCVINDEGLMNRNFGIGFFIFDRMFGTFADHGSVFNHRGYSTARRRFHTLLN